MVRWSSKVQKSSQVQNFEILNLNFEISKLLFATQAAFSAAAFFSAALSAAASAPRRRSNCARSLGATSLPTLRTASMPPPAAKLADAGLAPRARASLQAEYSQGREPPDFGTNWET